MSGERRKENRFIVYTDIVGHTKLFARVGAPFRKMRERHDELFQIAVRQYAPAAVVKGTGDGFYAAVEDVDAAVNIALMFRSGLAAEQWDAYLPPERRTPDNHIRSRVGVHAGLVTLLGPDGRPNDVDGQARTVSERVMSMAQGNQVLATRQVVDAARSTGAVKSSLRLERFGEYKLREIPDTVEIWAVGDDEHPPGPKPAQPPEHRVILFAVIADCAAQSSALGTRFDAMKDAWDTLFARAAAENGKDTFVKRLPDGSLAAFRNAVEAIRAARDFRRLFKNEARESGITLAPLLALDSGLVTFDYANNQAFDVRDQPVNIPAKMCKTGIVGKWQLLMSRNVRDDAWANLPEREEFKWVCIGQKSVPGEPEPLEIWEFQDIQVRTETRTVLWIDARTVKQSLASLPEAYGQFEAKLGEIVIAARSKRAEEPWYLPHETGLAAAFKDPIEAVLFARDLKTEAHTQQWERLVPGLKRAGRNDNLLRLSLHLGGLRTTYEDGLLKEFKGPVIDGLRPVIDLARNSQILLTRELKDAVAAGFQEGEVVWKRVDTESTAAEVYELAAPTKQRLLLYSVGGALAVALLVAILFVSGLIPSGGGLNIGARAFGEVPKEIEVAQKNLEARGDATLSRIVGTVVKWLAARDVKLAEAGAKIDQLNAEFSKEWTKVQTMVETTWSKVNSVELGREYVARVDDIRTGEELDAFLKGIEDYIRPDKADPRKASEWTAFIDTNLDSLKSVGQGQSDAATQLESLRTRVSALTALAWIRKHEAQIVKDSADVDALIAPGGELESAIRGARAAGNKATEELTRRIREEAQREAAKGRLPVGLIEQLITARDNASPVIQEIGRKASAVAEDYATANASKSIDDKARELEPLRKGLDRFLLDQTAFVLDALRTEHIPLLAGVASVDQMTRWLADADPYRRPDGGDPRQVAEWSNEAAKLRNEAVAEGVNTAEVKSLLDAFDAELAALRDLPLTRKSQADIKRRSEELAAKLAPEGAVRKPVAAAIDARRRAAAAEGEAARAARAARERLTAEIDALLARAPVEPGAPGADVGPVNERWASARLRFQSIKSAPDSDLAKVKADVERVMAGYAAVAKALAASIAANDERPWTRAVRTAADARRDAEADRLIESLQAEPPPAPETFAAAVAAAGQKHAAAVDAAKTYSAAWLAVENALNQALTLDDAPPGGSSVRDLIAAAGGHPLHADRAFADAVLPVSERAAALTDIAALSALGTLRDRAIGASRAMPEYVVAVWQRLGRPGLTGDAWLEAQIDVFRQLDNLGGPISADRKTQVLAAARRELPARWLAHFSRVQDANEVERCMLRRADFAVADADLAKLPLNARFNWRLSQLKEAVRGPDSDEKDAAVKRMVESVLADNWGDLRGQESVRQALDGLKAVLEGKTPVGAGSGPVIAADADPNQIGPALANWSFIGAKGDTLTYELKPPESGRFRSGGPAPRLEFVRLTAPGPDGAPSVVFLCTTEVSLRLVIDVVDRANAWGLLRGAFTSNDADRALPFVWQWPGGREAPMVLTEDRDPRTRKRSWIGAAPILASKSYYPPGVDPGEPSLDSPVQYVTPSAAGFIARLINCRLPSGAEWSAALDAEPGSRDPAIWNLRDQTFNATAEHVRKSALTGLTHPDYRSFEPPIADRKAYDHDDRTMWFADVNSDAGPTPRRFKHIVGNVAELVFEKPELFNGMRVGAFDAVDNIINKQPENRTLFLAAGGSAISARLDGDALFKPQAIKAGAQRRLFQYGCADLGFRLAFTPIVGGALDLSFSQRVDKVVQPAGFAAPAANSGG